MGERHPVEKSKLIAIEPPIKVAIKLQLGFKTCENQKSV